MFLIGPDLLNCSRNYLCFFAVKKAKIQCSAGTIVAKMPYALAPKINKHA